jgi:methyl-accepting chemotaxis protein
MKLRTQSIQFKLLATGLLSVLLPLAVVGYFSVTRSSEALMSLSQEKAQTTAADLAGLVGHMLNAEIEVSKALAANRETIKIMAKLAEGSEGNRQGLVQGLYEDLKYKFKGINAKEQYQGLYIADASGQILTGILESGEEYNRVSVAANDDFTRAKQSGKASLGEMIRSQATSNLVVPISAPIFSSDNRFLGTAGLVLKASYFTDLIPSRRSGETGYAFMVNSKGVLIAIPKPSIC